MKNSISAKNMKEFIQTSHSLIFTLCYILLSQGHIMQDVLYVHRLSENTAAVTDGHITTQTLRAERRSSTGSL